MIVNCRSEPARDCGLPVTDTSTGKKLSRAGSLLQGSCGEVSVVARLVHRLQHVLRQSECADVDFRVVVAGNDAAADEALLQGFTAELAVGRVGRAPGKVIEPPM